MRNTAVTLGALIVVAAAPAATTRAPVTIVEGDFLKLAGSKVGCNLTLYKGTEQLFCTIVSGVRMSPVQDARLVEFSDRNVVITRRTASGLRLEFQGTQPRLGGAGYRRGARTPGTKHVLRAGDVVHVADSHVNCSVQRRGPLLTCALAVGSSPVPGSLTAAVGDRALAVDIFDGKSVKQVYRHAITGP